MNFPPTATDPTLPTTAVMSNPDHDTQATTPTFADESTIVTNESVNDRDERRHWHPAVPGVRAAVPAVRCLMGGGRC